MRSMPILVVAALVAVSLLSGCSSKPTSQHERHADQDKSDNTTAHNGHEHHKHKAAHGGSLNAIVTCENGHAEVTIEGEKLQLWFVGGGANTGDSVRIPDKSIQLQMETNGETKTLVLNPKPLELAGEKIGDCSCFEGEADWLRGLSEFTADAQITFKGQEASLRIEYPKGYDPD